MLTMFALLLQTATLDTGPYAAAKTCAQALTVADANAKSQLQLTSQFTHLMMQAAKAKPESNLFDQLSALSTSISAGAAMTPAQAASLAPACRSRFPQAGSTAPARLPADSFRRDVLCLGTLSVLQGAAEEIAKNGDQTALAKIRTALEPLTEELNDAELKKRGLDAGTKFLEVMGSEMQASLSTGSPLSVAAACGASLG